MIYIYGGWWGERDRWREEKESPPKPPLMSCLLLVRHCTVKFEKSQIQLITTIWNRDVCSGKPEKR